MTSVFFEGLEFYGYHGVPAEERAIGHRYSVDVWIQLAKDPKADNVGQTVDYAEAMSLVQRAGTEQQFHTVEALASALADALLARFSLAQEVEVRVAKIAPPAPFIVERAGVEISRSR